MALLQTSIRHSRRGGLKHLGEILDWPEDRKDDPISMTSAEDGSGIGAAVIVAMALDRGWV